MKVPGGAGDWKPVPVGMDGVIVLLLSVVVAVSRGGESLALAVVLRRVWRTPSKTPGRFGVVAVLGHRLDKHRRPTPAFQQRLRRGRTLAVQGAMLHAPCAAEDRPTLRSGLPRGVALLHWLQTGWLLARMGRIDALARRIG